MKAYKRIKELAKLSDLLISDGAVVADVACDHGYLAELFHRNNKIVKVYATDISLKCLNKVAKLKGDYCLDKIEIRLGDGLQPLPKVDLAVIAGVGGLEIIKMLTNQNKTEDGDRKSNIFILQPAQNIFEFRKWLYENQIYIIKDYFIEDAKKFYPIIAVDVSKKQENKQDLFNLFCGRDCDKESKEFEHFVSYSLENFAYLEEEKCKLQKKDTLLEEKYQIYKMLKKHSK